MRCDSAQNLIFEYLYDLVEDTDRKGLEVHLESCANCQQAFTTAKSQQALLASAAKFSFSTVEFTRPVPEQPSVIPAKEETHTPVVPSRRRLGSPMRWVVAASFLLAVVGLTLWGVHIGQAYSRSKTIVAKYEREAQTARAEIEDLQDNIGEVTREHTDTIAQLERELGEITANLEVVGPKQIAPGEQVTYSVRNPSGETNDSNQLRRFGTRLKYDAEGGETLELEGKAAEEGGYSFQMPHRGLNRTAILELFKRDTRGRTLWEEQQPLAIRPDHYRTYLTLDKPGYRPGETLRFRSLTLDSTTLRPPTSPLELQFFLRKPSGEERLLSTGRDIVSSTNGQVILGPDGQPVRGIGVGDYPLSPDLPDGDYHLIVRETNGLFDDTHRSFRVQHAPRPPVEQELRFTRSAYRAGDEVELLARAVNPERGPVGNRPVKVQVQVDGKNIDREGHESAEALFYETDEVGRVPIRFKLPDTIEEGNASICVAVDNGGPDGTVVCPIPLAIHGIDVAFFPEGGDLVADLPCRVYFQAQSGTGEPIAIRGRLFADGKPTGVLVSNESQSDCIAKGGRGSFQLTPKLGVKYELAIDAPAELAGRWMLPPTQAFGTTLSVSKGVFGYQSPLAFEVRSTSPRDLLAVLSCRGTILAVTHLDAGCTEGVLRTQLPHAGICRLTIYEPIRPDGAFVSLSTALGGMWGMCAKPSLSTSCEALAKFSVGIPSESRLIPRAERLVYRRPQPLELKLALDKEVSTDKLAELDLKTEVGGKPSPAICWLSVTDRWEQQGDAPSIVPSMPAFFFLQEQLSCPEALENADVLLQANPPAERALDLFLAVHGWRRFVEDGDGKQTENTEVLFASTALQPSAEWQRAELVNEQEHFATQLAKLESRKQRAVDALVTTRNSTEYQSALVALGEVHATWNQLRTVGIPVTAAVSLVTVFALMFFVVRRHKLGSILVAVSSACAAVLLSTFLHVGEISTPEPLPERQVAMREDDRAEIEDQQEEPHIGGESKNLAAPADPTLAKGNLEGATFAGRGGLTTSESVDQAKGKDKATPTGRHTDTRLQDRMDNFIYGKPDPQTRYAGAAIENEVLAQRSRSLKLLEEPEEDRKRNAKSESREKQLNANTLFGRSNQKYYLQELNGWRERQARQTTSGFLFREFSGARLKASATGVDLPHLGTVYWHPVLVVPTTGQTRVQFALPEISTEYEATVIGHTLDGQLGVGRAMFRAKKR